MKKMLTIAAFAMFAAGAVRADVGADIEEMATLALKDAVSEAQASLAASKAIPAGQAIAILPTFGGNGEGQIMGLLKNAITAAGKTCVEGKEDPMWDEILKEIAWDERKEDILDAKTLDKLGKLKSAQYLMYGCLRRHAASKRYVMLELELHVSCIATKQHVWGGTFVKRHYAANEIKPGQINIPTKVRVALIDGLRRKIGASLGRSSRLESVKRVALMPVFGDIDNYAEGLFRDVLTQSAVTPVNLDVTTRGEARFLMREGVDKADAFAYAVLRDIDIELEETRMDGTKKCQVLMEMQLWIENGVNREIVWSDTVQADGEFEVGPHGWWDGVCHALPFLREHPGAIIWIPLLIVVGIIVLGMIISKATRVR